MAERTPMEPEQMQADLRRLCDQDPEVKIAGVLRRLFADPVLPENQSGRFRPHNLIVLWSLIGCCGLAVFIYFSCVPR